MLKEVETDKRETKIDSSRSSSLGSESQPLESGLLEGTASDAWNTINAGNCTPIKTAKASNDRGIQKGGYNNLLIPVRSLAPSTLVTSSPSSECLRMSQFPPPLPLPPVVESVNHLSSYLFNATSATTDPLSIICPLNDPKTGSEKVKEAKKDHLSAVLETIPPEKEEKIATIERETCLKGRSLKSTPTRLNSAGDSVLSSDSEGGL